MRSIEGFYGLTFAERKDIMTATFAPTPATPAATYAYYTFFTDAGHGWLKVPVAELLELGIEKDISGYSYLSGDYAYLEEDCDMAKFIDAHYQRGLDVRWNSKVSNWSSVRNYPRYSVDKAIGG
jgi:hypothetical protein